MPRGAKGSVSESVKSECLAALWLLSEGVFGSEDSALETVEDMDFEGGRLPTTLLACSDGGGAWIGKGGSSIVRVGLFFGLKPRAEAREFKGDLTLSFSEERREFGALLALFLQKRDEESCSDIVRK